MCVCRRLFKSAPVLVCPVQERQEGGRVAVGNILATGLGVILWSFPAGAMGGLTAASGGKA
jgi:hypothetical protein